MKFLPIPSFRVHVIIGGELGENASQDIMKDESEYRITLVRLCDPTDHKWVTDSYFFSTRNYETCSVCGTKKEEL